MKTIPVRGGPAAVVDDADYERLSKFKWGVDDAGYAKCSVPHPLKPGKQYTARMHRMIMGLSVGDKREVDHADLDKLNNRRSNLRIATRSANCCNKLKPASNTSGFKGVSWRPDIKKWRAYIVINGKRSYLGYFSSAEVAHDAYKDAAAKFHGEFANPG